MYNLDRRHSGGTSRSYRRRSRSPVRGRHGSNRRHTSKDKDSTSASKDKVVAASKDGKKDEKKDGAADKKDGVDKKEGKCLEMLKFEMYIERRNSSVRILNCIKDLR